MQGGAGALPTISPHPLRWLSQPLHPDLPESHTESVRFVIFQHPSCLPSWTVGPWWTDSVPPASAFVPKEPNPGDAPRDAWLSETQILPLPMAAHVGVLRVQGEDGLQEGEDNEPCHRERHPGPCAGEQKRQCH